MADKKFSDFNNVATPSGSEQIVGLSSSTNIRMTVSSIGLDKLGGTLPINKGGTGGTSAGVALVGELVDESNQVIGDSLVFQDDGAGNTVLAAGKPQQVELPHIQIRINGPAGITNTNDNTDFTIPYNNVHFMHPPNQANPQGGNDYFTPTLSGANQGQLTILQSGTYMLHANYSTYDLQQNNLPTVDGTKFLRITLVINGTKEKVLDNHLVTTSVNGEAFAQGDFIMQFAANDVVEIHAFHTGTNSGTGFPVTSNSLFNESTFSLVKVK